MTSKTSISDKKREIGITWGSVSGFQPFRDHGLIAYESLVERDFIIRASHNPNVAHLESQPFTIQYENSHGFMRAYTPDFKVSYRYRGESSRLNEVYEVKPYKRLLQSIKDDKEKYQAAFNYCKYNGYVFKFIHEHKIRDQRWENAKAFTRVKGLDVSEDNYRILVTELRKLSTSTTEELAKKCFPDISEVEAIGIVCSLIGDCLILYNADQPYKTTSKIWLPSNAK